MHNKHKSLVNYRPPYRNANLAIIMFSVEDEDSFNYVDSAINSLNEIAGNIPFIIIGNKMEIKRSIEYNDAYLKARKYNTEYIEVSSTIGSGIPVALDKIAEMSYANYEEKNKPETTNINVEIANSNVEIANANEATSELNDIKNCCLIS